MYYQARWVPADPEPAWLPSYICTEVLQTPISALCSFAQNHQSHSYPPPQQNILPLSQSVSLATLHTFLFPSDLSRLYPLFPRALPTRLAPKCSPACSPYVRGAAPPSETV